MPMNVRKRKKRKRNTMATELQESKETTEKSLRNG
jgi:hypothetical protein